VYVCASIYDLKSLPPACYSYEELYRHDRADIVEAEGFGDGDSDSDVDGDGDGEGEGDRGGTVMIGLT
jgi:hypothetical protein